MVRSSLGAAERIKCHLLVCSGGRLPVCCEAAGCICSFQVSFMLILLNFSSKVGRLAREKDPCVGRAPKTLDPALPIKRREEILTTTASQSNSQTWSVYRRNITSEDRTHASPAPRLIASAAPRDQRPQCGWREWTDGEMGVSLN